MRTVDLPKNVPVPKASQGSCLFQLDTELVSRSGLVSRAILAIFVVLTATVAVPSPADGLAPADKPIVEVVETGRASGRVSVWYRHAEMSRLRRGWCTGTTMCA